PLILSLVAALPLAGCDGPTSASSLPPARPKPVRVETVAVVERDMPSTLLLAGTLKPNQESELAANAVGRVLRTMVERGSLVAERYVSVGEYVRADSKVAHLIDIDPLRLELTIPEQNLGAVKMGQRVQFQVAAFPDTTFSGTVHYIGPSVRAATRDLVFEATV